MYIKKLDYVYKQTDVEYTFWGKVNRNVYLKQT